MSDQIIAPARKCRICKRIRLLSNFPSATKRRGRNKTGAWETYFDWQCKQCKERAAKARRATNPRRKLRRRFYDFDLGCWVKECRICEIVKPTTDFTLHGKYPVECKECARIEAREYRQTHKPQLAAKALRLYYKNHEKGIQRNREKYARDRVKILARLKNPKDRQRLANNAMRRAARISNAPEIEEIDRAEVIRRDNATCYLWCKRQLPIEKVCLEHVIPLSRNGPHTMANLRVACQPCNSRKGSKLLSELPPL